MLIPAVSQATSVMKKHANGTCLQVFFLPAVQESFSQTTSTATVDHFEALPTTGSQPHRYL